MGTGYWKELPDEDNSGADDLWDGVEFRPEQVFSGGHGHHGFPQEFRNEFDALGIDIDNYKYKLKAEYHLQRVHGSNRGRNGGPFNRFWEEFFAGKHGKPTKANALKKLKALQQSKWRIPTRWKR